MKAGCAYAPLLEEYPEDRIEFIKQDCRAKLVIDEAFVSGSIEEIPDSFTEKNSKEESRD